MPYFLNSLIKEIVIWMIFFYNCVSIKVTKQIVYPNVVFASNFKVMKNESEYDRKIMKWWML